MPAYQTIEEIEQTLQRAQRLLSSMKAAVAIAKAHRATLHSTKEHGWVQNDAELMADSIQLHLESFKGFEDGNLCTMLANTITSISGFYVVEVSPRFTESVVALSIVNVEGKAALTATTTDGGCFGAFRPGDVVVFVAPGTDFNGMSFQILDMRNGDGGVLSLNWDTAVTLRTTTDWSADVAPQTNAIVRLISRSDV